MSSRLRRYPGYDTEIRSGRFGWKEPFGVGFVFVFPCALAAYGILRFFFA
jgi:hypothetical protein